MTSVFRMGLLGSWKSRLPVLDGSISSLDTVAWSTARALHRRGVSVIAGCAEIASPEVNGIDLVAVPSRLDAILRSGVPRPPWLGPRRQPRWSSRRHHPEFLLEGVRALARRGAQVIQVTHEFANLLPARAVARQAALVTLLHAVWVDDRPALARRLLHADAVTAVSDFVRQAIVEVEPRLEERTFTVRNGVDLEAFPGRAAVLRDDPQGVAAWRERLHTLDRPLILAVGRVAPEKGHHTLAAAAKLLAERGLRPLIAIAGQVGGVYERPSRATSPLWREIEALVPGYADRVRDAAGAADLQLLGAVSSGPLLRLLAAADVFVAPSFSPEPCPLPLLEALAMDLPVVATDGGGHPELVGGAATLVAPGDAAALADALEAVLVQPAERERLARLARPQATQHSWDETARALVAVAERIA